ncbi:MAG: nitric-oxide reductase large subunit [Terrimicrobiaceae bacterium]
MKNRSVSYARLWLALAVVILGSFAVLIYYGMEIYRQAPPVPARVVTESGRVLFTGESIRDGQNVWQSMGGQQLGSVWGHGAYVAPDWSADWLHRECLLILDEWSQKAKGKPFEELDPESKAALQARLRIELRGNTHDPRSGDIVVSDVHARAFGVLARYYAAIFGDAMAFPPEAARVADAGMSPPQLRDAYAIARNTIKTPERQAAMNTFFWWAAWACSTERPGATGGGASQPGTGQVTYTNNWPPEHLIGNSPSGPVVVWSVISFVLLLGGIGGMAWYHALLRQSGGEEHQAPENDPLLALSPTPSMRATLRYFWVVAALIVAQVGLGAVTAHYGVEGSGFYGIPLDQWLPYSVTRTWHTQLGIFWIATAWLATGLFIAPAVSGHEPKFQAAGVNFLLACLVLIVVGSCFGTWYGTRQQMGLETNFWFGHQGYEYVDMGRFWQIFLLVGLFLWLVLMIRAIWSAFRNPRENRHLLALFLIASAAIAIFWAAGLMWHRQTNLAIAEYWRWWVVHLWVEGFFEVFATVVIAFLFTRMGLLKTSTATAAVLFATVVFLSGGIIGTFHHLYFTGTPTAILALGATFSALEVVPLTLIGFEAAENLALSRARHWVAAYRWPIYFFIAVAFWNLVGAGLFGFLINPPIALYFMQGLNTTAVHAHTALFGVYGMLGIGLMLFCLKGLATKRPWKTGTLFFSFWSINIGLILMVLLSLLPVGLLQTWASVEHGMWYARSAEFMQTGLMDTLRWLRVIGDTIFAVGILVLGWFVVGLKAGWSLEPGER